MLDISHCPRFPAINFVAQYIRFVPEKIQYALFVLHRPLAMFGRTVHNKQYKPRAELTDLDL